jgi:hypothetical protein
MKDFLKDAKWFIFSITVIVGLWFGPQVSDYFDDLERERLQEERRLAAIEKNKPVEVSDELFKKFQAIEDAAKFGLLCEADKLRPIRLIIEMQWDNEANQTIGSVKYLEPQIDRLSKTHTYELIGLNDKRIGYSEPYYSLYPKRISLYRIWTYYAAPISFGFESTMYLNRETLVLDIQGLDINNKEINKSANCSKKTAKEFEAYMINHNASVIKDNVL